MKLVSILLTVLATIPVTSTASILRHGSREDPRSEGCRAAQCQTGSDIAPVRSLLELSSKGSFVSGRQFPVSGTILVRMPIVPKNGSDRKYLARQNIHLFFPKQSECDFGFLALQLAHGRIKSRSLPETVPSLDQSVLSRVLPFVPQNGRLVEHFSHKA